jgi:acyl carrier protein
MSVADKVKEITSRELGIKIETISGKSNFIDDLGADSLDTVELIMAYEEEFGVTIPDEKANEVQTVQQVIEFIEAELK